MKLRRRIAASTFLSLAFALSLCGSAFAAAGDLDTTFGIGGFASAPSEANVTFESLGFHALQPDGKFVVAGNANVEPGSVQKIGVRRFSGDGAPDGAFAGDGLATIDSPPGLTLLQVTGIAVQQSGAIVIGARFYDTANANQGVMGVIRLTSAGILDDTFDGGVNGNGILLPAIAPILPPAPSETARGILVQADDKIVISGLSYYPPSLDLEESIMRMEADGTPDSSFSSDGKFTFNPNSSPEDMRALARIPGAGYVMGGYVRRSTGPTTESPTLSRITEVGALDPSFTGGIDNLSNVPGVVTAQWGTSAAQTDFGEINSIETLADGRMIAVGYSSDNGVSGWAGIARYTANGAFDPTFGSGGRTLFKFDGLSSGLVNVAVQADGKYIATGYGGAGNHGRVVRFNTNGTLDPTFGSGGILTIDPTNIASSARTVLIQPDQRPVLVVTRDGTPTFSLARLLADPAVPANPPAPLVPFATIKSPSRSSMRARSLKRFQGTAGPTGSVARVEIAVRKVDRKLLRKKRCLWMANARGAFKQVRSRTKSCKSQRWLKAIGTNSWSLKLKKALKRGNYELFVRTTLTTGAKHDSFTRAQGNLRAFKLR